MKRLSFIWFVSLLIALPACSPVGNCSGTQKAESTLHILFIGNSYTYVNDLPGTFSRLACAGGHKVETAMEAPGGFTLAQHLASQQTQEKLKQQQWNYVILQEQSEIPAVENARTQGMYPAARSLVSEIESMGAQPMFFLTWGHRDGLSSAGLPSYTDMQYQLDIGYIQIANELNIPIIPVGDAWSRAENQPNPIDLWDADGSHPNQNGTYLAACVFYASLFQQDPRGLTYRGGLSQETAQELQTLAAETALKRH